MRCAEERSMGVETHLRYRTLVRGLQRPEAAQIDVLEAIRNLRCWKVRV